MVQLPYKFQSDDLRYLWGMTYVKERTAYACGMKSLENNFYELCNCPTNFKFQSDDLCYMDMLSIARYDCFMCDIGSRASCLFYFCITDYFDQHSDHCQLTFLSLVFISFGSIQI